jgi:hypothetical protein
VDTYTPVAPHTPGAEATCTEAQTCTVCHAVLNQKTEHSYDSTVTPPTCTDRGYTTHSCAHCGYSIADAYTEAKGHQTGEGATCTAPGICTVCSAVLSQALGHSYTDEITPPACDAAGYTTHTCSRCSYACIDAFTEATGHIPGNEATCDAPQTCTVCGVTLTARTEHEYVERITKPTCTASGYTTHICIHCDSYYTDSFTKAAGHAPGAWITDREPTADTEGERHKTCVVCGERTATERIPALNDSDTEPSDTEQTVDSGDVSAESETPGHTSDGSDTISADDLMGTVSGCKKAQKIFVYVVIGLVMIIAAALFWHVESRRQDN